MAKRLVVMRHAMAVWPDDGSSDHRRPLHPYGLEQARYLGVLLVDSGWIPQAMYCSDATRTRQTCHGLRQVLPGDVAETYLPTLYSGDLQEVVGTIASFPGPLASALVLGHNPTMEHLVRWLAASRQPMSMGTAVLLESLSGDWRELSASPGLWRIMGVLEPDFSAAPSL